MTITNEKLRNWNPKDTRLKNIERKVRILDKDPQFFKGVPNVPFSIFILSDKFII